MGGRLGDSIRERQGMAYYVFSGFDANVAEGPLLVRAGVNPSNVDEAIASIDEELLRMAHDGVTPSELADAKRYLIGSMPRMLETNGGIAAFLHSADFFGLGLDFDQRLPGLLDAVTLDDVHDVARTFLAPDRATIVVAGHPPTAGVGPGSRSGDDSRLLRCGLHAHLSGADLPRRGVPPLRRALWTDARRVAVPSRRVRRRAGPGRGAGRHLRSGDLLPLHRADHSRDGRRWRRRRAMRRRNLRAVGDEPSFRDVRGCRPTSLAQLPARGIRIGLISNSHRCLASFQEHFELARYISAAVSSSQHGYLKPHPSIFQAALHLLGVPAGEAVMVGDSVGQDIDGARRVGMRAMLVRRGAADEPFGRPLTPTCPVIHSLRQLLPLLDAE